MNGLFLTKPFTGIGQYTVNLLRAMALQAPEVEWCVVVPELLTNRALDLPINISLQCVPEKKWRSASWRKVWWEQVQVPRALIEAKVNLIHYPYPCNPRFPGARHPKTVVTVHDIIPWVSPDYRHKLRSRLYQRNAEKALLKADHIIAVSEATASAVSDRLNLPYNKITTIHEAADPFYLNEGPAHRPKRPYLLYVGGYDPRKNVKRLCEAFEEYVARTYDVDLILVGGANHPLAPSAQKNVIATETLTREGLARYYRGALAFVNVSLAEGFNLPLLEAVACGAPILTSDIPVHREVLGEAGLLVDPQNTCAIGEAMVNLIRDQGLRDRLREGTFSLNEQYTWEKAAERTLALYRKIL